MSEVYINDNSEICSKNVLYPSNEVDNKDSEEDVDINNKIKKTRENEDVNVYEGRVLKFLDENGNEYPITGGKTGNDGSVYYEDDDDELNEEEEILIMDDQQE
jgi:hypothetical protein